MMMKQRITLFCASVLVVTVLSVPCGFAQGLVDHPLVQRAE